MKENERERERKKLKDYKRSASLYLDLRSEKPTEDLRLGHDFYCQNHLFILNIYPAATAQILLTARGLSRDNRAAPVETAQSPRITINTSLLDTLLQDTSHTRTHT